MTTNLWRNRESSTEEAETNMVKDEQLLQGLNFKICRGSSNSSSGVHLGERLTWGKNAGDFKYTMPSDFVIPEGLCILYRCPLTTMAQDKTIPWENINQGLLQPQGELYPIQTILTIAARVSSSSFVRVCTRQLVQRVPCPREFQAQEHSQHWDWRDLNSQSQSEHRIDWANLTDMSLVYFERSSGGANQIRDQIFFFQTHPKQVFVHLSNLFTGFQWEITA